MNTLEQIEQELGHMPEQELDKVLAFVQSLAAAHIAAPPAEELTPEEDEALAHWNCS